VRAEVAWSKSCPPDELEAADYGSLHEEPSHEADLSVLEEDLDDLDEGWVDDDPSGSTDWPDDPDEDDP